MIPQEWRTVVVAAHTVSTCMMVGIIWFVQIVHYPLFAAVGSDAFPAYQAANLRLTTWVVLPTMAVEMATAVLLIAGAVPGIDPRFNWTAAGFLAIAWLSTFLIQVPLHEQITLQWNADVGERLVLSNWIRTVAWSARGIIAVIICVSPKPAG